MRKRLDDLTAHCIRCGFCIESCPTFVVTGNEAESPRGRIYLIRSADEGKIDWETAVRPHIEPCLGCRACETACPSGVEYGAIVELAREKLEELKPAKIKHTFVGGLTNPTKLRAELALGRLVPGKKVPGVLSRLLSGQTPEAERPRAQKPVRWPPLDQTNLPPVRGEVYLLEGCVMRVLYPRVHQATRRLLRRVGFQVREAEQGCCGALHAHNGYLEEGFAMSERLAAQLPGDLPIVVNSAGCGSHIKEQEAFAGRGIDISQFLLREGLEGQLAESPGFEARLTYHDACHLAHGQQIRTEPRRLLKSIPRVDFVELPEADMCCGSAGIYNILQPKMARELLERKWSNVERTKSTIVATGNPGCHAWIAQASREHPGAVSVLHTVEVLEAAFSGLASLY